MKSFLSLIFGTTRAKTGSDFIHGRYVALGGVKMEEV